MKQRIEPADLEGLTDAQKDRLRGLREPQDGHAVLVPKGTIFGDGHGQWEDELSDEDIIYYLGIVGFNNKSYVSKEPCLKLPEYGDDNYLEIMTKDCLPLLNIGQMIEILGDCWYEKILNAEISYGDNNYGEPIIKHYYDKLCDALWQAVKEVL